MTDGSNRSRLDEAGGFCNSHFWLLAKIHSPESGTRLNEYIASKFLDILRDPQKRSVTMLAQKLADTEARCPLCSHLARLEIRLVQEFVVWLNDETARAQYLQSRGLCFPHFLRCLMAIKDETLRVKLHEAQAIQLERLCRQMRAYAGRIAANTHHGAKPEEREAWSAATEKLVGRANVKWPPVETP